MPRPRYLILLSLAGCGRSGFDARSQDAREPDARGVERQCTTETFAAGFPAGWMPWNDAAGFSAVVTNEELAIQLVPNANGYAGINTDVVADMTSSTVSVMVNAVTTTANAETYLTTYVDNMNMYYMGQQDSVLYMMRRVGGVETYGSVAYDLVMHRRWRIAYDTDASVVRFSTSEDGAVWTEHYQTEAVVPVDALFVELSAGTYQGGGASPGTPRYDDVEVCRPL